MRKPKKMFILYSPDGSNQFIRACLFIYVLILLPTRREVFATFVWSPLVKRRSCDACMKPQRKRAHYIAKTSSCQRSKLVAGAETLFHPSHMQTHMFGGKICSFFSNCHKFPLFWSLVRDKTFSDRKECNLHTCSQGQWTSTMERIWNEWMKRIHYFHPLPCWLFIMGLI